MPASITKFFEQRSSNGQNLYWGRAAIDGLPYRGHFPPNFTQEEFEDRTIKVKDPHVEEFDISVPAKKTAYLNVLDGAANGWFEIIYIRRPGEFDPARPTV